jgi:2-polyprenyl-6-methoxyphenol hydroxylase-like FAD-dependent oxidoreductase
MSSPLSDVVDVVISGAGPTGLLLACQLTLHGVKFRIFDKSVSHTTQSRALGVHARSLEIFDQMGIAEEAVERGEIVRGFSGFFNGVRRLKMDMTMIQTRNITKFPFILVLEQCKTEEILEKYLERHGVTIERQCELVDFVEQSGDDQLTEVMVRDHRRSGDDNLIRVKTKYICGCDGAHSRVREILKLSFFGETYANTLFVLDCSVKFLDRNKDTVAAMNDAQFNLTKDGIGLLFPLKDGVDCWRVIGTIPHELLAKKEPLQFEDIEPTFSRRMQRNIQLYNPHWISSVSSSFIFLVQKLDYF